MAQPTVQELGDELGLDPVEMGYWSQGGFVSLGEYVWYGPAIAAVPSGGSRTDNQRPSLATILRLSFINKAGQDMEDTLVNLLIGGTFTYGSETWVIQDTTPGANYIDISLSSHEGPDENFLAVATLAGGDSDIRTLRSVAALIGIGFAPTEVEQPVTKPVPWDWEEILNSLTSNGVDPAAMPWSPLELLARATREQDAVAFENIANTMEWKGEISAAARDDLIALTERTEEGTEIVPGPSRWESLWQITTIQTSVVMDARLYAMENYS
jgi:hypothetical protein